jgi:uncharacterized protein (TIGR02118 family)
VIKLVTFQKRVASLTRPQFEERWRTIHGPMAAAFPGLRGYVLGFSLDEGEPPADGVAQLWFDSREACQASYGSDIGRKGSADASAWLARREHLLASEIWLRRRQPGTETPFKLLLCLKRPAANDRAAFLSWLRHRATAEVLCGQTGAEQARLSIDDAGLMLNSQVAGALRLSAGEAPYDALVELWFATRHAADAGRNRLRAWKDGMLAPRISRCEDALLREHVVMAAPADGDKEGLE